MTEPSPQHVALCLVIGDPIDHSLSPLMHNAGYRAASLENSFFYTAARVSAGEVQAAFSGMKVFNIRGLSITRPLKEEAFRLVDELDVHAEKTGSINTVIHTSKGLKGINTDLQGIVDPLSEIITLNGCRCLVLGAGGTARAAIYGLTRSGAAVTVMNRTTSRADALAAEFNCNVSEWHDEKAISEAEVIINTTPPERVEKASPIPVDLIYREQVIFDVNYNPVETFLLREAAERGAATVSGIEMFVAQGAAQFELFTGARAPVEAMKAAVLNYLAGRK